MADPIVCKSLYIQVSQRKIPLHIKLNLKKSRYREQD